ncbi:hypothetical protein [Achromobacter sp. PAB15]|uniref:hypothetical protein n=1 Tax=Achromobacter sp. PAB15 TaxID=3233048 RepID=UPI003F909F30
MLSVYQVMIYLVQSVVGTAIVLGALYLIVVRSGLAYALYMQFAPDPPGQALAAEMPAQPNMVELPGLTSVRNANAGDTLISYGHYAAIYAATNAITTFQVVRQKKAVGFQLSLGPAPDEVESQVLDQDFAPLRISFPLMRAHSLAM